MRSFDKPFIFLIIFHLSSALSLHQNQVHLQQKACQPLNCNGSRLITNPLYILNTNGCGGSDPIGDALGQIVKDMLPALITDCCDNHDFCYATCRQDKDVKMAFKECNQNFKKCMENACLIKLGQNIEDCKEQAETAYEAVEKLGICYYIASQNKACKCR